MRDEGTDRAIADLARGQGGVVSNAQLRAAGLDARAVHRRAKVGRLHPVHRGVWAVGHKAIGRPAVLFSAVLACGEPSGIARYAAAEWWELREIRPTVIDVAVPGQRGRKIIGIRAHETTHLALTVHRGIPVTTVARTICDLAAGSTTRMIERDLDNAQRLKVLDTAALRAENGPGSRRVKVVLDAHTAGSTWTRNDFEEALFALVDRLDLPRPLTNQPVGPYVLDFLWPDKRLAVETDGKATHLTDLAFEEDRERDAYLWTVHRIHVMRFTYRQLTVQTRRTERRLDAALA